MRLFAILLLLVVSPAGFAFSLTPAAADQSIQYLGSIFGQIGGLLSGNASSLIGQIFYAFNYAVILLASILITYTLFVSILNTANDGEMMGKKWSSVWVPLRSVFGFALLLPKAGGYSAMQWIVMWIVLQGVGAADSVWSLAVQQLTHGAGSLNPSSVTTQLSLKAQQNIYTGAKGLLSGQVCVDAVNATYGSNANFSCNVQFMNGTSNHYQVVCGGTIGGQNGGSINYDQACGTVTPDYATLNSQFPADSDTGVTNEMIYNALPQALTQMLVAVKPAAQAIVDDVGQKIIDPNSIVNTPVPGSAITNAVNTYESIVGDAVQQYYTAAYQTNGLSGEKLQPFLQKLHNKGIYPNACDPAGMKSVAQTAVQQWKANPGNYVNNNGQPMTLQQYVMQQENYYAITHYCSARLKGSTKTATSTNMEATGWFNAGRYYLVLAEESFAKSNFATLSGNTLPQLNTVLVDTSHLQGQNWQNYQKAVVAYGDADSMKFYLPQSTPGWMVKASLQQVSIGSPNVAIAQAVQAGMGQWATLFDQLSGFQTISAQNLKYADPLITTQRFGATLINDAVTGFEETGRWFMSQESNVWWQAALPFGKIWATDQVDYMMSGTWYLPLGVMVLGMMLSAGMMLAVYMPLIPFILFTLGGIGWILGVIEAMVAAPLVCFGIMHPNAQNDVVGKAEPAVMLMINMFIRPTLMIVGLLLGIGLIYVSLTVINSGFAQVVSSVVTFGGTVSSTYLAACLMAIYGLFVTLVIQKCFSLITIIPDNVLRWIQGGDVTRQQFGEMSQIAQQMDQKVGQGANQVSQAAGSTASQKGSGEIQVAQNAQAKVDSIGHTGG